MKPAAAGRTNVQPTATPVPTPFVTPIATPPTRSADLRPAATEIARPNAGEGYSEMVILVAVIAAVIAAAIVLSLVIYWVRSRKKQIFPADDFEEKQAGPKFVVKNIHAVNTVLP
jgi:hypothetical protein